MLSVIHNERPDYTQNNLIRQPYYLCFSEKIYPAQKKTPHLIECRRDFNKVSLDCQALGLLHLQ
jgi:hypothetical protein